MSLDVWQRSLGTNLQGTFLTCKHALHHMLGRDSGSIVNLSSINGLHGFPNRASYAASKAGVVNLTQTIAAEVEGTGIRVNAICPARVDTPRLRALAAGYAEAHQKPLDEVITDFGFNSDKVMSADDVAGVITFLTTTNLGRWFNGQALVMGWA
jgi:NAD(P)-dependent dehydrogenase (short-subunit alcohol dehydrogenase family)